MNQTVYNENCPVEIMLRILGGKWKIIIIYRLINGTKRFNELHKSMPKVTQRMLTSQLRELELDQIVHRQVYAQVPPKVEYSLTEVGKSLWPVLLQVEEWGKHYLQNKKLKLIYSSR